MARALGPCLARCFLLYLGPCVISAPSNFSPNLRFPFYGMELVNQGGDQCCLPLSTLVPPEGGWELVGAGA